MIDVSENFERPVDTNFGRGDILKLLKFVKREGKESNIINYKIGNSV